MAGQMNEAAAEQETYREEERARARKTHSAIERVQLSQEKLEAKQEEALQQLQI